MNSSRLTQKDLEKLIDRYFEADTSECEETLLRHYLVYGQYKVTPAVRDALAVMSLSACRVAEKRRRRPFAAVAGIAAMLAVAVSASAYFYHAADRGVCEMYIAGVHVSDHDVVMKMIETDFDVMKNATASGDIVDAQLSEFMDFVGKTND